MNRPPTAIWKPNKLLWKDKGTVIEISKALNLPQSYIQAMYQGSGLAHISLGGVKSKNLGALPLLHLFMASN